MDVETTLAVKAKEISLPDRNARIVPSVTVLAHRGRCRRDDVEKSFAIAAKEDGVSDLLTFEGQWIYFFPEIIPVNSPCSVTSEFTNLCNQ